MNNTNLQQKNIGVLIGTNRQESLSSQVAKYYIGLLNKKNINPEIIDLSELPDNFTSIALYENRGKNNEYNILADKLKPLDIIVLVVPEYNFSYPGILKAFIDGLKFPGSFDNKTFAMIGVSKGDRGCIAGMNHLTNIFNYLGAKVLPLKARIHSISQPDINLVTDNEEYIKNTRSTCRTSNK